MEGKVNRKMIESKDNLLFKGEELTKKTHKSTFLKKWEVKNLSLEEKGGKENMKNNLFVMKEKGKGKSIVESSKM